MSTTGVFSFPILSDREILDTMSQLNIPLEINDLTNPESKKVVSTFVNLMSASSGIPPDEISVYDRENAKKFNLEGNQHLLSVITVFGPLSDYMNVCRVHDFAFSDLLQPTAARFREQLSAAINFIMFSDDIINKLRVYREKKDQLSERIRNVEYEIKVNQSRKDALEMQKQKDRDTVVEQKEKNKRLEEEIERLNIEQQRLKESNNAIKVQMKEVTRAINSLEDQIKDENQTTLELGDKIVTSPRKLKQDVADMKDEYSRLTAECRTLTLQSTDLKAQAQVVKQALTKLNGILKHLEDTKGLLMKREELNNQLEEIKNRIRELKKLIEDQAIEEKKCELQLNRQEEEVEDLRKKVVSNSSVNNEKMQVLTNEYNELIKIIDTIKQEEEVVEKELTSLQVNKEQCIEEYHDRMNVRVELMNQLIDRVHSYQQVITQSFPQYNVCSN